MDGLRLATPVDPAEEIERLRRGERLLRAVEALGDPCRKILLGLFASPPRPYGELARELGLPLGSLGPTRGRCLQRLRTRLGRERNSLNEGEAVVRRGSR